MVIQTINRIRFKVMTTIFSVWWPMNINIQPAKKYLAGSKGRYISLIVYKLSINQNLINVKKYLAAEGDIFIHS
jgi:hypothetical protein